MPTFTLSDATVAELRKALDVSTDVKPESAYVSEQDLIIAGIVYAPPAGGWPHASADQSKPTDDSRVWLATGSKGQGYYIDNKPHAFVDAVTPWPYTSVGLFVVLNNIGTTQELRTAAEKAGIALVGDKWAQYYAANVGASPYWNVGLARVISGQVADQVITDLQAEGAKFDFNAGQLVYAKLEADKLK